MNFGEFNLDLSPRLKIQNLKLNINPGVTHLWGKNGVGKTTLLNLILADLRRQQIPFAYITQNYRSSWLWWYSVRQNLQLALEARCDFQAGLRLETLPEVQRQMNWLQPLLVENQTQINFNQQNEFDTAGLSGGQLQRVILFRELLHRPQYVLLDEAFSALDREVIPELAQWILDEQAIQGFKIISISHNQSLVAAMPGQLFHLHLETVENILHLEEIESNQFNFEI